MEIADLPTLNASLNALASVFLVAGYVMIRSRRIDAHRRCMLSALGTSALVLISYVIYHANAGSVPFRGTGAVRVVYFAVLIPHIILAAAILPASALRTAASVRSRTRTLCSPAPPSPEILADAAVASSVASDSSTSPRTQ